MAKKSSRKKSTKRSKKKAAASTPRIEAEPPLVNLTRFAESLKASVVYLGAEVTLRAARQIEQRLDSSKESPKDDRIFVLLHSPGGDPHAAYLVMAMLRRRAKEICVCVPYVAKSAATLMCLGADKIIMGETAQLGPLDPQIREEIRPGRFEATSTLTSFATHEQLCRLSIETFDIAIKTIMSRSTLDEDAACRHAIEFVRATTGSLYQKLDPQRFGESSRALDIGKDYGLRLLQMRNRPDWDNARCLSVLSEFIHGYPSHDYIIDFEEMQQLGFEVEHLSDGRMQQVMMILGETKDLDIEYVSYPTN